MNPTPAEPTRPAFGDESFLEAASGGFYVLAAAVFDLETHDEVRDVMRSLRGGRKVGKLHWNEMDAGEQRAASKVVAGLSGLHVVTVGSPVGRTRQERARAACLRRLVHELHSYEVDQLTLEARTVQLDRRDVDTVKGARFDLPKGAKFRLHHVRGPDEELLWASDIVAGAVRAHQEGKPECRLLLDECVYEIEVETDSGTSGHA